VALARGRREFESYVRDTWFPDHRIELRTRENHSYYLEAHIIPHFTGMAMGDIYPSYVRAFATGLEARGVAASSVGYCLTVLSAIFTAAMNDQLILRHACQGVRPPRVAKKIRQIITPEQYDAFCQALPARDTAGLGDDVTPHSLRHAHASWLAGHSMKVVQETLGLSSITIAADTYTSVLPELARQSAEDVAALISLPPEQAGKKPRRAA
jgi:site-specific recombinase XerD